MKIFLLLFQTPRRPKPFSFQHTLKMAIYICRGIELLEITEVLCSDSTAYFYDILISFKIISSSYISIFLGLRHHQIPIVNLKSDRFQCHLELRFSFNPPPLSIFISPMNNSSAIITDAIAGGVLLYLLHDHCYKFRGSPMKIETV